MNEAPFGRTLLDKIWDAHLVTNETTKAPATLYIDLHLLHEVTSAQAFDELRRRGIGVRRSDRCLATMDHATPTLPPDESGQRPYVSDQARSQVATLVANCREHGIRLLDWDSPLRGIVHVIGPELGETHPGATVVCGDSHTSTHGALGALAFGIGTTEVGHVLATQCLLQRKPRSLAVTIEGEMGQGVGAKDMILHVIGLIGTNGGTGHVIEYRGSTVRGLSMEARMTLCNMSIECGARAGMVAPDETTWEYLRGRPGVPQGDDFDAWVESLAHLHSDPDAVFDREIVIDAAEIAPTITYGTNPGMVVALDGAVPEQADETGREALAYMEFEEGQAIAGQPVDLVFIGSCTNARISDLRVVAEVLKGRTVSPGTRVIIVPGSESVKRQAEAEGLHDVYLAAGAEWRISGCSLCIAMNGDHAMAGQYVISTSNRNFEGRQGGGARTLLASPLTAAVSALHGRVTDPREMEAPA